MKFVHTLKDIGLSDGEALVYSLLLEAGQLPANTLAQKTGLKRPTVYNMLKQLVEKNLVEEIKTKSKKEFSAKSPEHLESLVTAARAQATQSHQSLELSLPELVSAYMLSSGKPHIVHFEGIAGVKKLYEDIIAQKTDILLIRSIYDERFPELETLVNRQIKQQVKHNLHTRAITPVVEGTEENVREHDAERLVTRHLVRKELLSLPAQIVIYGPKVGITAYRDTLLTTIIDNQDIRDTFEILFDYLWRQSTPEDEKLRTTMSKDPS